MSTGPAVSAPCPRVSPPAAQRPIDRATGPRHPAPQSETAL